MSAARHPGPWHNGPDGSKYVFIPGNAKPINAGSIDRAAFIVAACNTHSELVATLRLIVDLYSTDSGDTCINRMYSAASAALAKVQA